MITLLWIGTALAAPEVNVPFQPPATAHLFTRAGLLESKAAVSGDSCDQATADALEDLQGKAKRAGLTRLVSVSVKADGDGSACRQRRTGDTVLQSVVLLDGMALAEDSGLPTVPVDRAVTVAATLGAASGGLDALRLEAHGGLLWWAMPPGALAEDQAPTAQAATMVVQHVFPAISTKAPMLATAPEVSGLVQTFASGKKKTAQALRVFVPTALAVNYLRGASTDDELLLGLRIESQQGEGAWAPVASDALALEDAGAMRMELRDVDVEDGDIEGLEDEADAGPDE